MELTLRYPNDAAPLPSSRPLSVSAALLTLPPPSKMNEHNFTMQCLPQKTSPRKEVWCIRSTYPVPIDESLPLAKPVVTVESSLDRDAAWSGAYFLRDNAGRVQFESGYLSEYPFLLFCRVG
jgi:hypothetical protein